MLNPKHVCLIILLSLLLLAPTAGAKVPLSIGSPIKAVAWEEAGRVHLAIANTSSFPEELTVAFGYQRLGARIVEEFYVDVPAKTILVEKYAVVTDASFSSPRVCDMVYLFDYDDRQISTTRIIGIHGATEDFKVDSYLVPAGEDAIVYLETPNPDLDQDTEILVSIGKTYSVGSHWGKLIINKIYKGALSRTDNPYFGDLDDPEDYHSYTYGWRGLVLKMPTPQISGLEWATFDVEKFITTKEGTARHGVASPPIMVYGQDFEVLDE